MTDARRSIVTACLVLLALVVAFRPAEARQQPGSIGGKVTDRSGQVLGRVTVTAKHRTTGDETTGDTRPDGTFTIGGLDPGTYLVSVNESGFRPFQQEVTLVAGQRVDLNIVLTYTVDDFSPVTDRWRLRFPLWQRYPSDPNGEYPFVPNRGLDPYDQNVLKGDLPIIGDSIFLVLTAVFEMPLELRRLPTPSGVSTERPDSEEFFGESRQYALLPTAIGSVELFHGSTAFKPRDWAIRVTPTFNLNYLNTQERNVVNATPEEGATRTRHHLALQEAFGEVKLFDIGPNYDFVSVRGGIQPFNSDFRGFLFRDTNFGIRAFGTFGRNRNQWNVALFDQLEKETNSELNLLERRKQRVVIANFYRQDFLTPGYTISPSFHMNDDRGDELTFDENGFLVRPAPIGLIVPHRVKAYYAGVGGDGHIGRLNITHQFYQAFGTDEFNGISGQEVDINAQFAAVEVSIDRDWLRPRAGVLYASGDDDPDDDRAKGFDAILDDPNIAGGQFGFFNRQAIRLAQTGLGLVGRNSVLPSLRSSKTEGQASFVNPGVLILTGGLDAQITPKMRISGTVDYLRFQRTEVLQRILFQSQIDKAIGFDGGVGVQYRPALNDNVTVTGGVSFLMPGNGFKQILTTERLYTTFLVVTFTY